MTPITSHCNRSAGSPEHGRGLTSSTGRDAIGDEVEYGPALTRQAVADSEHSFDKTATAREAEHSHLPGPPVLSPTFAIECFQLPTCRCVPSPRRGRRASVSASGRSPLIDRVPVGAVSYLPSE